MSKGTKQGKVKQSKPNRFKYTLLVFIASLLVSINVYADGTNNQSSKVDFSPLFIELSDAMEDSKNNEVDKVSAHLNRVNHDFTAIEEEIKALNLGQSNNDPQNPDLNKAVENALNISLKKPTDDNIKELSKSLYALEQQVNPPDYNQQRKKFKAQVLPVYDTLNQAVASQDLARVQGLYKQFNDTWTRNEKVVRATSLGHYGQIETAMTYLRVAMLGEPTDFKEMQAQSNILGSALDEFMSGKIIQPAQGASGASEKNAPTNLEDGIKLLEKIDGEFAQNNKTQAQKDMALFIQQWAVFEGEVSTRDGNLYTRVESDMPIIMAKGHTPEGRAKLQNMISNLKGLKTGSYGVLDAMVVLLREGVEALLIIMALLTALTAAKQTQGKKWVYAGAFFGIALSVVIAIALQKLFPALSAGTNREILEGLVGIFAVIMMLLVGAWLHGKSSIKGWNAFIDKRLTKALTTGSLVSMMSLSFLVVFREGAETMLFYAGMLPKMATSDFLMGIGMALVLLALTAFVISKTTARLPVHHLFKMMTWLIYFLGFKVLGVSIQALQLTKIIPTQLIDGLPTLPWFGFFPTWEGLSAQLLYIVLVILSVQWSKTSKQV